MDHLLKEVLEETPVIQVVKAYKKNQDKPLHPELKKVLSDCLTRVYEICRLTGNFIRYREDGI